MLDDQYFIDDLKSRADLVRIVEMHVPLKKKGTNRWGNCPFHGEKTPSFSVNPAKGFFGSKHKERFCFDFVVFRVK